MPMEMFLWWDESVTHCLTMDLLTFLLYSLKRTSTRLHVNLDAGPVSIWKYSWPLNNKNLNCKCSLICGYFSTVNTTVIQQQILNNSWLVVSADIQPLIWRNHLYKGTTGSYTWVFTCAELKTWGRLALPTPSCTRVKCNKITFLFKCFIGLSSIIILISLDQNYLVY